MYNRPLPFFEGRAGCAQVSEKDNEEISQTEYNCSRDCDISSEEIKRGQGVLRIFDILIFQDLTEDRNSLLPIPHTHFTLLLLIYV